MPTTVDIQSVSDLFRKAGDNAHRTAIALSERVRDYPLTDVDHERIKQFEQGGDDITRKIIHLLLDHDPESQHRQEYYALASAVDDVVDHIEHVSDLLDLYKVEAAMQQALDQCDVLIRATSVLRDALAIVGTPAEVGELLVQLKAAEDEGDQLERNAIAALFADEHINPRVIIQWKDIFEGLESAIDACESAGHVIGNLMLKTR